MVDVLTAITTLMGNMKTYMPVVVDLCVVTTIKAIHMIATPIILVLTIVANIVIVVVITMATITGIVILISVMLKGPLMILEIIITVAVVF